MPSQSDKQRRYVFYLRGKYGSKEKTPEKDKWVWEKGWEKVKEDSTIKLYKRIFKEAEDKDNEIDFETALKVGLKIGIDFNEIDPKEFHLGINIEKEHGQINPDTDITPKIKGKDNLEFIGQIAHAHLNELKTYYSRLIQMEKEGKEAESKSEE